MNRNDRIAYQLHHRKQKETMTTSWQLEDLLEDHILITLQWKGEDACPCPSARWPLKILKGLSEEGVLIIPEVKRGFFWWFTAYLESNAMESAFPHVIEHMREWCEVQVKAFEDCDMICRRDDVTFFAWKQVTIFAWLAACLWPRSTSIYRGDASIMKNVLEHPGQLINSFIIEATN